jgi:hypothetical protein
MSRYFIHSRLFEPVGYSSKDVQIREVGIIKTRRINQDYSTAERVNVFDRSHVLSAGAQRIADSRFLRPDNSVY